MKLTYKRLFSLLLVLIVVLGIMPAVFAAEMDESVISEPQDEAASDETTLEETEMMILSLDDGIATIADSELVGYPQDFCNLFLWNEITISGDGFNCTREHIPLYAMHMTDQPGYETNFYVAYCIEPGVIVNYGASYEGNSYIYGDLTDVESILNRLTADKIKTIGVALLYGQKEIARRADEESIRLEKLRRHAATQVIIWEIACGWRSATPPYTRNNSTLYDAINCEIEMSCSAWDTKFMIDGIADTYNEIVAQMEKHYVLPSFASDTLSSAKTYTMITNSAGQQTITLTDTNNILSEYTFKDTDNIKYTVSSNKLTITVTGNVSWPLTISPTMNIPDLDEQVFFVWENGDDQKMISSFSKPVTDSVPCYFKLNASTSSLSLTKTTEDGNNLAGWQFNIYSDQSGTKLISGPHETDSRGKLTVSNLSVGTVWVKEIGHKDATVNALYQCESDNPQKVTLTAGQTATVSFYNMLNTGICKIVKIATNGGSVSGWKFTVTDSSGNTIGPYSTDSAGNITVDLEPGTYTVTEVDKGNAYWHCDTTPQTVAVKAGETATVTFENQWIGKAMIIKALDNPEAGSLEGWTFTIADANGNGIGTYQTAADGTIVVDLEPGTYTVTEVVDEDSLWYCISDSVQTVTVSAGQTAEVTFTNALRPGELYIEKVDTSGNPLDGVEFLLEWSEDGENWYPVTYTSSAVPQIGGCTTEGVADGKLVSDADGLITFSGLYPTLQYRLTETATKDGYQLLSGYAYEGSLPIDNDLTVSIRVVNVEKFMLPKTGTNSLAGMPVALALCLCVCVSAIAYLRKKES